MTKDENDRRVEALQSHGIDVFHETKGLEYYKEYYKKLQHKLMDSENKGKPKIQMSSDNNFLKG